MSRVFPAFFARLLVIQQRRAKHIKDGFHQRRSRIRSRSRSPNQKRRAYDVVKTAFRFGLRSHRLRYAYDLVKNRLSESEAEEPNQSQGLGTWTVIDLSFRFCFRHRQSGFH